MLSKMSEFHSRVSSNVNELLSSLLGTAAAMAFEKSVGAELVCYRNALFLGREYH
jgi:hypothetical protein